MTDSDDGSENEAGLGETEELEDSAHLNHGTGAQPFDDASDSLPPHIIAVEILSDDENEELCELKSIVRNGVKVVEAKNSLKSNS